VLHHDRSANLLPLLSLCPSGTFVDRIPHRPWFTVNDHCTGCGDCLPRCPEPGCILPAGEPAATPVGTRRVRIVPEACTGCGLCLPACPPQAIRVVGALGYGRVGSQVL
jgi:NAD-dependent dihydropyrimidine dehydrogenase PreA subunit